MLSQKGMGPDARARLHVVEGVTPASVEEGELAQISSGRLYYISNLEAAVTYKSCPLTDTLSSTSAEDTRCSLDCAAKTLQASACEQHKRSASGYQNCF